MISKRHVLVLIFFVPCIVIYAQKKTCVNMVIKLRPIENYRGKLKNCTVSILENNAVILKSELKGYDVACGAVVFDILIAFPERLAAKLI